MHSRIMMLSLFVSVTGGGAAIAASIAIPQGDLVNPPPVVGAQIEFIGGMPALADEVNKNFSDINTDLKNNEAYLTDLVATVQALTDSLSDRIDEVENGSVPTGTVVAFAGTITPSGWLLCDGRALDPTDERFKSLFEVIGTAHGGDGIVEFNLPDYRGRFLRGVDREAGRDPDVLDRMVLDPFSTERNRVGSVQESATALPFIPFAVDMMGSHTHTALDDGDHSHGLPHRVFDIFGSPRSGVQGVGPTTIPGALLIDSSRDGMHSHDTDEGGTHSHTIATGGDAETRPENSYVDYIIKF